MRWLGNRLPAAIQRGKERGPALIAVGLIVLLADAYWPAIPVVTSMAFIAMGASLTVVSRFRYSPAQRAMMAANLFTYSTLYLLFVGAVVHSAMAPSVNGLSRLQGLDLALSIAPMIAAVRIAVAAIAGDEDVPAR